MSAQVFSQMPVVMTSATLPRGLAARVGAPKPPPPRSSTSAARFAYKEHGLLYCATTLPDRRRDEAEPAIHDEIEALVLAAGGRTLALFTSRRAMTAAAEALAAEAPLARARAGRAPQSRPCSRRSAPRRLPACSPTMSFWQGVDVPGPALTLVVIDRIPFPRPGRPADGRPPRGRRAGPGSRSSTCRGRRRSSPRVPAGSSGPPPTRAWSPCSTRASPRPPTGRRW